MHLDCLNDTLDYISNFDFDSGQPKKSPVIEEEEESELASPEKEEFVEPAPKKIRLGMIDAQNYIKSSLPLKSPTEVAKYITDNEITLRNLTIALSILLTDKIVLPSVIEMELDVVFSSSDATTLQSDLNNALIEIIRTIASQDGYAILPELVMSDLTGRLTSATQDDRIATYAHSLAALCRSFERPDVVRTVCYELLLHYSARGLEPNVIAALFSSWSTPFAGLSSFPLPGAWVLSAIAAVTEDVVAGKSALLWEKIKKACIWDTDTSMKAIAELLVANEDTEKTLSNDGDGDNDERNECIEQWVLCSELMRSHFGKAEWVKALRDAEANRNGDAPHISDLLNDYLSSLD